MTTSAAFIAAGLAVALVQGDHSLAGVTLGSMFSAPLDERLVMIGVLALVVTPVLEVIALIVAWTAERDWRFVGVGFTIAVILVVAALIG